MIEDEQKDEEENNEFEVSHVYMTNEILGEMRLFAAAFFVTTRLFVPFVACVSYLYLDVVERFEEQNFPLYFVVTHFFPAMI